MKHTKEELAQIIYQQDWNDLSDKEKQYLLIDKRLEWIRCEYCKDLDEQEFECPDAVHHGACYYCEECGAEYYEEYMGDIFATNKEAHLSHPELKQL